MHTITANLNVNAAQFLQALQRTAPTAHNVLFTRWQKLARQCGAYCIARRMQKRGYSVQLIAHILGTHAAALLMRASGSTLQQALQALRAPLRITA